MLFALPLLLTAGALAPPAPIQDAATERLRALEQEAAAAARSIGDRLGPIAQSARAEALELRALAEHLVESAAEEVALLRSARAERQAAQEPGRPIAVELEEARALIGRLQKQLEQQLGRAERTAIQRRLDLDALDRAQLVELQQRIAERLGKLGESGARSGAGAARERAWVDEARSGDEWVDDATAAEGEGQASTYYRARARDDEHPFGVISVDRDRLRIGDKIYRLGDRGGIILEDQRGLFESRVLTDELEDRPGDGGARIITRERAAATLEAAQAARAERIAALGGERAALGGERAALDGERAALLAQVRSGERSDLYGREHTAPQAAPPAAARGSSGTRGAVTGSTAPRSSTAQGGSVAGRVTVRPAPAPAPVRSELSEVTELVREMVHEVRDLRAAVEALRARVDGGPAGRGGR